MANLYMNHMYQSSGNTKRSGGSGGIGFTGLLQVALIVLKLLEKIDWPWWLVLAPTWCTTLFVIAIIIGYVMLSKWVNGDFDKKKEK